MSFIRKVIPSTIAANLIGIQPMSSPKAQIHSLRIQYDCWHYLKTQKRTENNQVLDKIIYSHSKDNKRKIEYKIDGKLHRILGPAVIIEERKILKNKELSYEYWIDGKQIPNELVEEHPTILIDAKLRKILS